ncbi:nSTAND1 domain-containing NTPase [Roseateles sp. DB2]|uniref:nSTAND1 domain-containing NTPase n=1 Tax=Roseateles sp. DB2 TaxID=3453717 RepID=UPI003EE8B869
MTVTGTVAAVKSGNVAQARPPAERFELGEWRVDPATNRLSHPDGEQSLEPRAMAVLLALCEAPGEVVSAEALLERCWADALAEGGLGDNPVHKSINQLRRALGDSATDPRYIETIRKRGYRVIAPVRGGQGQARSGAWQGGSPFRGLQAFDTRHAEVFFGREQATQELLQCASQQLQRQHGLVLVLGPSGSGKTSLVSAGLLPALYREPVAGRWHLLSHSQLDLADLTGPAPEESREDQRTPAFALALAAALLDWETPEGEPLLAGFNAHDLARALTETPQAVLAELRAALQRPAGAGQFYALLFIDRLEALFRPPLGDEAQREPAQRLLQLLAESGYVLLVAACRNDYYPQLAQHAWLMRDKTQGGHLDLAPPSRAEIAQMVRLPARAAGLSFGVDTATHQRLDDLLCDAAAASPDALPLLQYTLEQLYQQRSPHGELSFAAYRALGGASGGMGGLEGVIAEQAEQLIRGLTLVQQEALPHVLSLLVLVGEDESSPVGGRRALWSELRSAAERELVQALVDARLLVSERSSESAQEAPGFRVAHEALLRRWPRVTDWIAQHRQDLQTRARLRQQVQRWEQGGRAVEFLWPRGRQLQDALALRRQGLLALAEGEQRFLDSCQRRAAWAGRLKGGAVAALAGLTVLAAGMAWRAQQAEGVAQQRRQQADDLVTYMLGEFADKLRPIGRLELLDSVGAKTLSHLAAKDEATPMERLQRAKALTVIGEVRVSKRELDTALEPLQQANALLEGEPPSAELLPAWRKAQGAAAFWLGHVYYTQRKFEAAQGALKRYQTVSEDWVQAVPGDLEAQTELAYAENNLGTLFLDQGALASAESAFRRALAAIDRVLARGAGDDSLRGEQANMTSWLGSTLVQRGRLVQAEAVLMQALLQSRALHAAHPGDQAWLESQGNAAHAVGDVLWRSAQASRAAPYFQEAVVAFRELLAVDPSNRSWSAGAIRAEAGLMRTAAPTLEAVQRLLARLEALEAGRTPSIRWHPVRAELVQLEARLRLRQGDSPDLVTRRLLQTQALLNAGLNEYPRDLPLREAALDLALFRAEALSAGEKQAICQAAWTDLSAPALQPLLRVHAGLTRLATRALSCLDRPQEAQALTRWLETEHRQRSEASGSDQVS